MSLIMSKGHFDTSALEQGNSAGALTQPCTQTAWIHAAHYLQCLRGRVCSAEITFPDHIIFCGLWHLCRDSNCARSCAK